MSLEYNEGTMPRPSDALVPIRNKETESIVAALLPGHVLQVCGPPMSGKSSLVEQAVSGINPPPHYMSHTFSCEGQHCFDDVLKVMAGTLGWTSSTDHRSVNEELILSLLTTEFGNCPQSHHVLIFDKCQGLLENDETKDGETTFLNFILLTIQNLSETFKVSIVLTTSKMFPLKGANISCIEVGLLDFWDILAILQRYAPGINVLSYVNVCLNAIPFPGAVKHFAQEFLANNECPEPPEVLETKMVKDSKFLSAVFGRKLNMVEEWVPQDVLTAILHFCQYLGSSFTEAHLECVVASRSIKQWNRLFKYLKKNYIVLSLKISGMNRLVVHPLVVCYWTQCRQHNQLALQGNRYDKSCNRFTDFLCRLLRTTEMNIEHHGKEGLVYGCLAMEWPHVRHTVEMAINSNENTYKTFLKAAVSARTIMLKCFNKEALVMYQALFDASQIYGTVSENAMIEAILGHLKASTFVLANGGTWKQAEECLDSAIVKLQQHGPPFALMWAICRKAIILTRQGKNKEALRCFKAARRVTVVEAGNKELEEMFGVSRLQVKEDKLTREIYAANAFIFLGENETAKGMLLACLEFMQNEFSDHSELATLLNSLGLVSERGHSDLDTAVGWYEESYRERLKYASFNRDILVISLNNIGMVYLRLGKLAECRKRLEEALNIRRELGWVHSNTILTLTHLGVLNIKCGDYIQAYKHSLDAEKILEKLFKIHDTRLRVNNTLGHLRHLLETDPRCRDEDVKLEKSAQECFEHAIDIASRIVGNFSDDGYHHFRLAHEHAMLLALGNSKERYNSHKTSILPYFAIGEKIGRKVFAPNEKIPKHDDLYKYFSKTDYEDIDKRVFVGHLAKACEYCQLLSTSSTAEALWFGDKPRNGEE